jgi:hypothetical protein
VAGGGNNGVVNRAFIGTTSGSTVIPLPSGLFSGALGSAINDSGQVVGTAYNVNGTAAQAFIGTTSGSTAIPLPSGLLLNAFGYAINDSGQGSHRAFSRLFGNGPYLNTFPNE